MAMHGGSLQPSRASAPSPSLSTASRSLDSVHVHRAQLLDPMHSRSTQSKRTSLSVGDGPALRRLGFDAQTGSGSFFGIGARCHFFLPAEPLWDAQPHASSMLVRPSRAHPAKKKTPSRRGPSWCCGWMHRRFQLQLASEPACGFRPSSMAFLPSAFHCRCNLRDRQMAWDLHAHRTLR
ncbi:uncharacterized protein PAN0_011d4187 [Moesziomyces antarcticus]|uniref:Uncharacterized protein n=2 Tax=Pseudozyma antarctica TaxID=84753 RepID=A0A081CH19_PSEA2|nr:uncharacterized protein PAN0_011d4187 [Moesziomyces antarcticus]GAK65965.1 hypothetical protein PAN0_011d4187 [Moesziomyces antarcticus]SPO46739.1 uncharacterized protein PSANT_04425 [Moesziomyces antarcticus]